MRVVLTFTRPCVRHVAGLVLVPAVGPAPAAAFFPFCAFFSLWVFPDASAEASPSELVSLASPREPRSPGPVAGAGAGTDATGGDPLRAGGQQETAADLVLTLHYIFAKAILPDCRWRFTRVPTQARVGARVLLRLHS